MIQDSYHISLLLHYYHYYYHHSVHELCLFSFNLHQAVEDSKAVIINLVNHQARSTPNNHRAPNRNDHSGVYCTLILCVCASVCVKW